MPEFPWISHYAKGVPAKIDPDFCPSIPGLLERVAKDYADYPAFISMEQPLTYRQVNDISSDLAGYLQSLSTLKPGDRVAIMMPNILQYPVSLFGVLKAGCIAVNVNPLYTARELHNQLADSGAKVVIIAETFGKTLEEAIPGTAVETVISTGIADLFPFFKRTLVNFAVKYVKKNDHALQRAASRPFPRRALPGTLLRFPPRAA